MLSGFNTNFRYRGVLFHVQTEDSGRANPHVITHLFHGGNILASVKRDYSELLVEDDLEEPLRKLMEGLHKSMLKQLSRGEHDTVIMERLGEDVFLIDSEPKADPPTVTQEELPPPPGPAIDTSNTLGAAADILIAAPTPGEESASRGDAVAETVEEAQFLTTEDPAAEETHEEKAAARLSRVFGDRVVSEKPLDEVVLDYLVDNARKRKRNPT